MEFYYKNELWNIYETFAFKKKTVKGRCNYKRKEIFLLKDLDYNTKRIVLTHEIIHVILKSQITRIKKANNMNEYITRLVTSNFDFIDKLVKRYFKDVYNIEFLQY